MGTYNVYVGEVAMDEYYRAGRWPGLSDKEEVVSLGAVPGGTIANAACVSAALGVDTRFCVVMNKSATSRALLEDLNAHGINTDLVVFDEDLPDPKTMIFLVGDENTIFIPTPNKMPIIDLTPEQLEVLGNAQYLYGTADSLLCMRCGSLKGEELLAECRSMGAKVAVDFDVNAVGNGTLQIDLLFLNEAGFANTCSGLSPEETLEDLFARGVEMVVVTRAEKGCDIYTPEDSFHQEARQVPVVDAVGAGDTFCSSFISVLEEMGPVKAATFATAAASICIQGMGPRSGAVSRDEVEAVLAQM